MLRPLAAVLLTAIPALAQLPSPASHFGFPMGEDRKLVDWADVASYYRKLDAADPRIRVDELGKTTDGKPFLLATVSSADTIRSLDRYIEIQERLADPRAVTAAEADRLVDQGKAVVLITCSIHSSEVASTMTAMEFVHRLLAEDTKKHKAILDNVVLLLVPSLNPDGVDRVARWYRRWVGTPYEGAPMTELYHEYVGHDNNRDWFMLTQAESRVTVVEGHMRWRPQIVIDQHQMGGGGARMFVPPYQEPYEPFMHPLLRKGLTNLGRSVMKSMIDEGNVGVWCNTQFDAWTPARAFMHYHGAVRILTEVASARLADPIRRQPPPRGLAGRKSPDNPAPWGGGRWGLDDIVRYTSRGALHAIRHGAEHKEQWLTDFHRIHKDQCDGKIGPAAYVIPSTGRRAMASKLLDIFTLGGVEVDAFAEPVVVGERTINRGFLIRNGQPNFSYACALLENSPYPEIRSGPGGAIRRPYDMTCHSLPLLMDFEVVKCDEAPTLQRPRRLPPAMSARRPRGLLPRRLDHVAVMTGDDESGLVDAIRLSHQGIPIERTPSGDFIVHASKDRPAELLWSPETVPLTTEEPEDSRPILPRKIGVYWSWTASMDEGWTRFWFDMFQIPFIPIRPGDVREGNLRAKVDVLLMASVRKRSLEGGPTDRRLPDEYKGGLGISGLAALNEFVRGGGTLICMNDSSPLAIDLFDLPVERLTTGGGRSENGIRVYIPGSVVNAHVDTRHPLGYGCNDLTPIFLRAARPFRLKPTASTDIKTAFPIRYRVDDLVAGGFAEGAEVLRGKAAAAVCDVGHGKAVLFAFSPQFRCQTWSTFRLLLNALLL